MIREYRNNMIDTDKEFKYISQAEKVVLAKELERSGITGKLQEELDGALCEWQDGEDNTRSRQRRDALCVWAASPLDHDFPLPAS